MPQPAKSPTGELFTHSRIRSPELLSLYQPESAQHYVQFYDHDSVVIENVAYLVVRALERDGAVVIVATEAHLQAIQQRLSASAADLEQARQDGRYMTLDAADTLQQLLTDGMPDKAKFDLVVGGIMRTAAQNCPTGFVFAFGEMVALLCAGQKPDAAVRLEQLWNGLAHQQRFSLYCAYSLDSFTAASADLKAFFEICSAHALTIPAETPL